MPVQVRDPAQVVKACLRKGQDHANCDQLVVHVASTSMSIVISWALWEVRRMKRTIHPLLLLAVTILGALWHEVQLAQSQDHIFANPPMLSSHDGRLHVELTAAPATYIIDGHQFPGTLYNAVTCHQSGASGWAII
jgi:hypothetical protein